MGLVFSLTSFTCTTPLVGGLLVWQRREVALPNSWNDSLCGGFRFSVLFIGFSTAIALAAAKIRRLAQFCEGCDGIFGNCRGDEIYL